MRHSAASSAALLLLAAACTDLGTGAVPESPRAPSVPPGSFRVELRCTADVAAARLACGGEEAPGGPVRNLIVGGQNVYVRMASSNAGYNPSDSLFSVTVSVQNLMAQPFGTPDGMTDTGLRVFFSSPPTALAGSGNVAVHNADGADFFLAADQPFFGFAGPLYPGVESEAEVWQFKMDPEVTRFVFSVLVQGELPHEESLLLFRPEYDPAGSTIINGLWGASADEVFAVGFFGTLMRFTGGAWTTDVSPTEEILWDVWGSSATNVFAVGDAGTIVRWDGAAWDTMASGVAGCGCEALYGVWGSGPDEVWAVGDGGIVTRFDGTEWTARDTLPVAWLGGVWGTGPDDVYAAGDDGGIFHYDGTSWTAMTSGLEGTGEYLNTVWGLSATDIYAPASNGVLHYDGVSWSPLAGAQECEHMGVWGTAPDDLFVTNICGIDHWDGETWAYMDPGGFAPELWGAGPLHLLANTNGAIVRGSR